MVLFSYLDIRRGTRLGRNTELAIQEEVQRANRQAVNELDNIIVREVLKRQRSNEDDDEPPSRRKP